VAFLCRAQRGRHPVSSCLSQSRPRQASRTRMTALRRTCRHPTRPSTDPRTLGSEGGRVTPGLLSFSRVSLRRRVGVVPRRERRRRADRPAPRRTQGHDQLRRVGVGILAMKLALVAVIFDPGALIAFALPKTLLSEALAAGLAAAVVMLVLRDGARTWIRNPVVIGVVGYFLVYAIASIFALDRYLALFGSHDRLLGLLAAADMAVTAIALIVMPRAEDLAVLVRAALAGGVVACAYGLAQLVR